MIANRNEDVTGGEPAGAGKYRMNNSHVYELNGSPNPLQPVLYEQLHVYELLPMELLVYTVPIGRGLGFR